MDGLSQFLSAVRVEGSLFSRAEMAAPWGVRTKGAGAGIFHVVVRGSGHAQVDGVEAPIAFRAGDLLVMPHGHGHVLRDTPASDARHISEWPTEEGDDGLPCILAGADGPTTSLLCGTFRLDPEARGFLLPLLPPVIHVPAGGSPAASWLDATLRLMADELDATRPGGAALVARLADLLFVHVLRSWIDQAPPGSGGWLTALGDARLARALGCIHGEPHRSWSVDQLAAKAGMSRSAFFTAFSHRVGETPAAYLLRWRMTLAQGRLRRGGEGIAGVAEAVGYGSEAAFSRAFKRHVGVSPSVWRRAQAA
ncbi:MAG: AraC family transcriptional regulator [Deltaproteobacteria bacterium]|nr:AraC family transcriptional regulator [Deltaproteobacteria bacterium]